jgi:hypothetical protein
LQVVLGAFGRAGTFADTGHFMKLAGAPYRSRIRPNSDGYCEKPGSSIRTASTGPKA